MTDEPLPDPLGPPPEPGGGSAADEPKTASRRAFLGEVATRARYVAPVVVMLAMAPRGARGASGCVPSGTGPYNTCTANEDCCSNNCVDIDPDPGLEDWKCQPP